MNLVSRGVYGYAAGMSFDPPAKGFRSRLETSFEALTRRLLEFEANAPSAQSPSRERSTNLKQNWPKAEEQLVKYLDLLMQWGKRHDLTAARSADELVDLTLPDAMVLAWFAQSNAVWADIGTGAGAPGLPLKFLRPDLQMTLVEPRTKRVAFLRTVVGQVNAGAIPVRRVRSDELADTSFDAVVSRAVLAPQPWLEQGSRLTRDELWVLLAQAEAPLLEGHTCDVDVTYTWPLTGVVRRALRFRAQAPALKAAQTPR